MYKCTLQISTPDGLHLFTSDAFDSLPAAVVAGIEISRRMTGVTVYAFLEKSPAGRWVTLPVRQKDAADTPASDA